MRLNSETNPMTNAKDRLREVLIKQSVCWGEFTLVSGAKSDFYVDSKLTTFDPRGANLVGEVGLEIVKEISARLNVKPVGIGGLTMGADPIALAIAMYSAKSNGIEPIQMFAVRKSPKAYGRNKLIEGNFPDPEASAPVVVVDDVITTGGSTIKAIQAVEDAGGKVAFVLALVDRQEGGRQNIEALGHEVVSFFTRSDLK
jgi:orotate phosphoribosyltransferase